MEKLRKERREFPRLNVELFVRYKIVRPPEQEVEAKTKNISGGGVCLITREQLKPGVILAMDIKFPHSTQPALVSGRVVWSAESGLGPSPAGHERFDNGIEFVEINDLDRQRIIEHVNSEQEKTEDKGWKVGVIRDLDIKKKRKNSCEI